MAVELKTNVVIGGQTTASFNALASRLESLGAAVEKIGSKVREFEGESVDVYRSYEDNLLAAEYALSAQYTSATELSKVMAGLNEYASEWAATTIFHTSDVSKAINEAAHAGWDYTEIVKGIPQAMLIAQAGSMDLSEGLDYLIKMMNTTGTSFDNMGTLIDQWAKAANLSATDINEMGEAFMSLSASAMFADNTQELFTMLAVLANAGVTGTKAGTLIRNAMMRVVAPTDKAKKAMAELGATEEELAEWTGASDTAKELEKLGFSAYDTTTGELKPMRDILISLHDAISGMNEEARYDILSTIFPLRSINAATAFYNAIDNGEFDKIFKAIGDSEGYAAKGSEIMMSGLTGAIETLASKWEEFQRSVGETLAPAIESVAGWLGNIMDAVNNMDEGLLSAVVGGLTTMAGLGAGLMDVGAAIKIFTTLGPWGTSFVLAAVGAGALYGYLSKTAELDFKDNFGQMGLDLDALGSHVDSLGTKFTEQQQAIATWEAALEQAESDYATKSSQLSELLLQDVLEGKELTPQDIKKIGDYAGAIYEATWDGIENAQASDKDFLKAIFGDRERGAEEEAALNSASSVVDAYYDGIYAEAYQIGEEMRKQMTAALQDGNLDENERQAIQATVDRLNQINAEIAALTDKEGYYEQLHRAQSVSWDTAQKYVSENAEKMEAELAAIEKLYDTKFARINAAYDYAIETGLEYIDIDGKRHRVTEEDKQNTIAEMEIEEANAKQSTTDKYARLNYAALDSLLAGSDYETAWKFLRGLQPDGNGGYSLENAFTGMTAAELTALNESLGRLWADSGKIEERAGNIFGKSEIGTAVGYMLDALTKQAGDMAKQWATAMAVNGWETVPTKAGLAAWEQQNTLDALRIQQEKLAADIAERQARMDSGNYAWWDGNGYHRDYEALYGRNGDGGGLLDQKAEIDADVEKAEEKLAALKEEAEEETMIPLDANMEKAEEAVQLFIESLLVPKNMLVQAELDSGVVDSYQPKDVSFTVTAIMRTVGSIGSAIGNVWNAARNAIGGLFAEGGRADTASIFGEAGPEWAIPEEHSARTAELLDAARQASGFTWGDLISRFGGLNGNAGSRNLVLHYAPTINAGNADGVAQVLATDKNRILKMVRQALEEDRMRNDVEVYA